MTYLQEFRATGRAPLSWLKIVMIPVLIVGLVVALLLCSGVFGALFVGASAPGLLRRPSFCYIGPDSQHPFTSPVTRTGHGPRIDPARRG